MRRKIQIIFFITMLLSTNLVFITEGKDCIKTDITQKKVLSNDTSFASLSYCPDYHDFKYMKQNQVDSTTFEIWNSGCCTLSYTINEDEEWVDVSPISGSSRGERDEITVTIDTSTLEPGSHRCNVTIISNKGNGLFKVFVTIIDGYTDITVTEAWNLLNDTSNGIQIPIDVRTESEWKNERIDTPYPENPIHHNYYDWGNPDVLNDFISSYKGKEIIIYCAAGGRSSSAASILVENEFDGEIYNMIGGISEWKRQGYPTIGNTILNLSNFKGKIGSFSFDVKNIGDYIAKDITYNVSIKGGIFSRTILEYECTECITELKPEESITESTENKGLIFGFGKIEISISYFAENIEETTIKKEVTILGIFILFR